MKFLYLWPFFLLLLIPVIIIMYLLKQKAVDMPIASLFLWKEMYRNVEANTPWEKLKKNWLLILQIITVIALIIALASPYIMSGSAGADHAIIVIDNSASMNALYDEDHTRLETAVEEAEDYVRSLKTGTGISIITSNSKATLVLSNSDDKTQAMAELKAIENTYINGDCIAGVEMVKSMQTQWDSVETVCFTDTNVSMEQVEGYIVDMYVPVNNASVDYVGHGVGSALHEEPEVPNFLAPNRVGRGPRLIAGMVIAIEPMVNVGTYEVKCLSDGWTVKTVDGSLSSHYENTVLITKDEPVILTADKDGKHV